MESAGPVGSWVRRLDRGRRGQNADSIAGLSFVVSDLLPLERDRTLLNGRSDVAWDSGTPLLVVAGTRV
jgi:hypothetical protein